MDNISSLGMAPDIVNAEPSYIPKSKSLPKTLKLRPEAAPIIELDVSAFSSIVIISAADWWASHVYRMVAQFHGAQGGRLRNIVCLRYRDLVSVATVADKAKCMRTPQWLTYMTEQLPSAGDYNCRMTDCAINIMHMTDEGIRHVAKAKKGIQVCAAPRREENPTSGSCLRDWESINEFNIREASLDNRDNIPIYTALSYTWGTSNKQITLEIDNTPFEVSENLAQALDNIVDAAFQTGRYLWIDQICINQQDRAEQSSQVRFMSYIYEKAAAVCVWLGEAGDDHDLALDIIRSWTKCLKSIRPNQRLHTSAMTHISPDSKVLQELVSSISSERQWTAVNNLAQRAWWGRAWVVQEATGPAETYIMCGQSSMVFSDLIKALLVGEMITQIPGYPYRRLMASWAYSMLMVSELRRCRQLQLLDALQFIRRSSCRNPLDKVYAVLGLVQRNSDIVIPDYEKSTSQVYMDVLRYCIATYPELHRLDFLGYVSGTLNADLGNSCPSFVPNWHECSGIDNFKKTTREYKMAKRIYHASLNYTGHVSLDEESLSLDAFDVDIVTGVGKVCESESDLKATADSWRPHDPSKMYVNNTCTEEEAYLHTIIGDVYRASDSRLIRGAKFDAKPLDSTQPSSKAKVQESHLMRVSMHCNVMCRRMFRTKAGFMGIGPACMEVGDEVYGFLGGQMLYVLRRANHAEQTLKEYGETRTFLGECYIHGLMDGEALRYGGDGLVQSKRIILR